MNTIFRFVASLLVMGGLIACAMKPIQQAPTDAPSVRERVPASVANPGVVTISNPGTFTQVVAISDVHGMHDALVKLLRVGKIIDAKNRWIAGRTLLIVVGDSIDKGPESIETLDLWIELQPQAASGGGQILHLLGNHEAEFLAFTKHSKKSQELIDEAKSEGIKLKTLSDETDPRGHFLLSEPVAAKVGMWLFSHAGLFPDMTWAAFSQTAANLVASRSYTEDFFVGDDSILEARSWEKKIGRVQALLKNLSANQFYGVVFGHQPKAFDLEGKSGVLAGGRIIKIDNGMAPDAGSYPGSLLVFANPAEMSSNRFPTVRVIEANGNVHALTP